VRIVHLEQRVFCIQSSVQPLLLYQHATKDIKFGADAARAKTCFRPKAYRLHQALKLHVVCLQFLSHIVHLQQKSQLTLESSGNTGAQVQQY